MSLTQGLSNATSGLSAAARMASVVSSNLANALTDGYGRRSVALSSQVAGKLGAGVQVDAILRHVDRGLQTDRRAAEGQMGGTNLLAKALSAIEVAWAGNGSGDGIAAALTNVDTALARAAGDPASELALGAVVDNLQGLTRAINSAAQTVQVQRQDADRAIADNIAQLNHDLKALEDSNAAIAKATYAGYETGALMDSRQQLVDRIATIVPVRELDRPGNQIALVTTSGEVLIDGKSRQYGFDASPVITAQMTLADGSLSPLTRYGQPLDSATGFGLLGGGTLEAAFRLRDTVLVAQGAGLDAFALDLITRFAAADPTQSGTVNSLLTDGTIAVPSQATAGLAGQIRINATLDPAQGGRVTALRDGLAASLPASTGDARQISAWRTALTTASQLQTGGPTTDAVSHAARLTGQVGQARLWADESQTQAAARWSALRQSELATGVDSDQELQTLLRIEQAYAANARVVTAIDDMFTALLRI